LHGEYLPFADGGGNFPLRGKAQRSASNRSFGWLGYDIEEEYAFTLFAHLGEPRLVGGKLYADALF
jgi:hypothetical protein